MAIRIVADDKIPFLKGALEPYADIEYMPGKDITREMLTHTDALIVRTRTRCNRELLEGTAVRFIATATIGFDHIDTVWCEHNGVIWTNAPGCNSGSVQQYMASALLHYASVHQMDLQQHVLGIVGVGNVGKKVLKIAEALEMPVVLNDPPRARAEGPCGFLSLDGIIREADIISFHVPLNLEGDDRTFHMIDRDLLGKLNDQTVLINTSRGEVVNCNDLREAMHRGSLAAVIIDVWEDEPAIDPWLAEKAFIATPHIAGYSIDGKAKGTMMSVQAISRFFDLGIDSWEPDHLPEPARPILQVNGSGKNFQEILTELALQTYDIGIDNTWLKKDISDFEYYRGAYPVRREYQAYTVESENISETDKRKLRKLGFGIK